MVEPLPLPYFRVLLELPPEFPEIQPGQFVMVETHPGLEPYLRRAFSVHTFRREKEGAVRLELLGKVVGRGTQSLASRQPGDRLALLGPLGRGFSLPEKPGERVALVAGGVGSAPLLLLAERLLAMRACFDFYYGGRTCRDLPRSGSFETLVSASGGQVFLSTEDGSRGVRGRVVELVKSGLRERPVSRVYACGPMALLARLQELVRGLQISAEGALETEMACGFGACLGCAVPLARGGYALCCQDGPVFLLSEVSW
jgi:dihydroorotate dehydrogenase electron transfer subunit